MSCVLNEFRGLFGKECEIEDVTTERYTEERDERNVPDGKHIQQVYEGSTRIRFEPMSSVYFSAYARGKKVSVYTYM